MLLAYFYWHYVLATHWLATFTWHLEQMLLQFFSVGFLLRTLFAHWRRDAVAYRGSLGDFFTIWAWNLISRAIGFIIRSLVLSLYVVVQLFFILLLSMCWLLFLLAPLLVLVSLVTGLVLLFRS
jgi:hypothetical protein